MSNPTGNPPDDPIGDELGGSGFGESGGGEPELARLSAVAPWLLVAAAWLVAAMGWLVAAVGWVVAAVGWVVAAVGWFARHGGRVARFLFRRVRRAGPPASAALGRLAANRFALAGLVLVALAALYGAAAFSRPAAPAAPSAVPARTASLPVTSAVAVCPDPSNGRVSIITPPQNGSGEAWITDAAGTVTGTLDRAGIPWSADVKKGAGAWTVRASGVLAAGLVAEQTTAGHGLAGLRCASPATDMWFLGPGPAAAQNIDLYMTDVDDQPVTIDIEAITDGGEPVSTGEGAGLTVGPYSTRLIHIGKQPEGLAGELAGTKLIGLHIQAVGGRVAASVWVRRAGGAMDWLPPIPGPASDVLIPGLPSGGGGRRLLIAAPGENAAKVAVRAITAAGVFTPTGQEDVEVPAGTVLPLDLGLGGSAAGIRLTANAPIMAVLIVDRGAGDFAVGAPTPPLAPGTGVADARPSSTLILTAPDAAATLRLTTIGGSVQEVRIPAQRTEEVPIQGPVELAPLPGSGPVYGARFLEVKGQGITLLPIVPAPISVPVGPVVDSPLAGVR